MHRVDWLLSRGVRTIQFCGGEPTIHPALPQLLAHVHGRGGKTGLTTNAIALPDSFLPLLRASGTQVKVSLHGDHGHHDAMVGRAAFEQTTRNLRRLLAAGIPASVQTTVVAGAAWVVEWVAAFCLGSGVQRLSIMPFIPRGRGNGRRNEYGLSTFERCALHDLVTRKRRALNGRLDLRWLDFTARPVHVLDADGRVLIEGATESMDRLLCRIPPPIQD
jgi:MoaA/NifB/PqqE/SkfB family radical SAM enzyme